ncbi:MAG: hypothetical protein RL748_58 [Pseudomonadota bacterium]|jgi:hypothetical protein
MFEHNNPEISPPLEEEPGDIGDISGSAKGKAFDSGAINIQPRTDSLRNLMDRLKHNEIDMDTAFQRRTDLWNNAQMSRLIESILIRFPMPPFYFDATNDEKWLVIDGLQRLSTIRKFALAGELQLTNMEYLKELNGKRFMDLERQYARRIDEYPVSLYLILPGTAVEVKYSIFRRINTGGLTLTAQEIRHAMASPRERKFLHELTQNNHLLATMGNQSRRMADQELVLRFLAFYINDLQSYSADITEFIDNTMERLKSCSDEELQAFKSIFNIAISHCYRLLGEHAFEKKTDINASPPRKNPSLFEALMVCIAKLTEHQRETLNNRKDRFSRELLDMTTNDQQFNDAISFATQKLENITYRHNRITQLIDEVCHA